MSGGGMELVSQQPVEMMTIANGQGVKHGKERCGGGGYFQMPLHYPRYTKDDYQTMPEWKLDCILAQYGLLVIGDIHQKRKFAMGAFLWPPH